MLREAPEVAAAPGEAVEGKVKDGLKLLVDYFSLGIITMIITLIGYLFVGAVISFLISMVIVKRTPDLIPDSVVEQARDIKL